LTVAAFGCLVQYVALPGFNSARLVLCVEQSGHIQLEHAGETGGCSCLREVDT